MPNITCAECNSEIPEGTELCPECGFPTEAGKVSCPECLKPVSLSLDACPECGFSLESLREAAAATETAPTAEPAAAVAVEAEPVEVEVPADAEPEVPADAEPEAPADAEPEAQADAEPEAQADAEPEAQADAEPEVPADAEPAIAAEEVAPGAADELDEPVPEPAEPEDAPVEAPAPPPIPEPAPQVAAVVQEPIVINRIEAGDDVTDAVHQAQIASLNALTDAITKMIESGGSQELAVRITELLHGAEAGKNAMLTDLISSISKFVDTTEKVKDELKEQNVTTVTTMQQLAENFSNETKAAAEGISEAQKGAIAEINNLAQQIKAAAAREAAPKSDIGDYVFYICLAALFFIAINIAATAYVVQLVR